MQNRFSKLILTALLALTFAASQANAQIAKISEKEEETKTHPLEILSISSDDRLSAHVIVADKTKRNYVREVFLSERLPREAVTSPGRSRQ